MFYTFKSNLANASWNLNCILFHTNRKVDSYEKEYN